MSQLPSCNVRRALESREGGDYSLAREGNKHHRGEVDTPPPANRGTPVLRFHCKPFVGGHGQLRTLASGV